MSEWEPHGEPGVMAEDVGGMVTVPEATKVGDISELVKLIEEAGSVEAAMAIIQERMHPNGMCGCCGSANPIGSKMSARGIPACSMLCAYHLLHPGDIRTPGHYGEPALLALRTGPATEDVVPEGSEDVPELRSDLPRDHR